MCDEDGNRYIDYINLVGSYDGMPGGRLVAFLNSEKILIQLPLGAPTELARKLTWREIL